jgi:hypothetical protein
MRSYFGAWVIVFPHHFDNGAGLRLPASRCLDRSEGGQLLSQRRMVGRAQLLGGRSMFISSGGATVASKKGECAKIGGKSAVTESRSDCEGWQPLGRLFPLLSGQWRCRCATIAAVAQSQSSASSYAHQRNVGGMGCCVCGDGGVMVLL